MIVQFSENLSTKILRMDKYYDATMNQINITIALEDASIDDFIDEIKLNDNHFNFTIGEEIMQNYSLVQATENYDASSNVKSSTIVFVKTC